MMKSSLAFLAGASLILAAGWIYGNNERSLASCRLLLLEGKTEQSLAAAQAIVAADPQGFPGIECLVRARLALGQEREAEAALAKFSAPNGRESEALVRLKAEIDVAKVAAANRAAEIFKTCQELQYAIGRGEGAESEEDIRSIVAENPHNRDAHRLLANFHLFTNEDYVAAIRSVENALRHGDAEQRKIDEEELAGIRSMARTAEDMRRLVEQGNFRDARIVFDEFRGEGRYSFEIMVLGAASMDGMGDTKEAIDELKTLSKLPIYSHGEKAEKLLGLISQLESKLQRAKTEKSVALKLEQAELAESEGRNDDTSNLLMAAAREGRRADLVLRVVDLHTRIAGESQDDTAHLHLLRAAAALAEARSMEPDSTTKSIISRTAEGQVTPVKVAIAHFRAEIAREVAAYPSKRHDQERLRVARQALRFDGLRARPRDAEMIESLLISGITLSQYPQEFWADLDAIAAAGQSEIAVAILAKPEHRQTLRPLLISEGIEGFPSKLSAVLRRKFEVIRTKCTSCDGSGQGPRAIVRCPGPDEDMTDVFYLSPGNGWPVTIIRGPCDNGLKRGSITINRDIGLYETRQVKETHRYAFRCTRCDGKGDSFVPTRCTGCDGRTWNPDLGMVK